MEHFALLLLASLMVGLSKGGLASVGALAVPILSIWMNPLVAAGWLLPIFLVSDCVGLWLYRKTYSRKNLLVLIPAGLLGVLIATLLAPYTSVQLATGLTGLVGLSYCAQVWYKHAKGRTAPIPFNKRKGVFWGILTGITSFISHTGAPPYQAFVLPQGLPKLQFAGTTTLLFAAVNLSKLPAYASVGLLDVMHWPSLIAMAVVACIGAVVGKQLATHLTDRIFYGMIHTLLFVLSVYLIAKALI